VGKKKEKRKKEKKEKRKGNTIKGKNGGVGEFP